MRLLSARSLWIFVLVGFAAALVALAPRVRAESANRSVELVIDYVGLMDFCLAEGLDANETLRQLKANGVTAVAYPENTLERLRAAGKLNYYVGEDLARALRSKAELAPSGVRDPSRVTVDPRKLYVVVYDPALVKELKVYLKLFLGPVPEAAPGATPSPTEPLFPDEETLTSGPPQRFSTWPAADMDMDAGRSVVLEIAASQRALEDMGLGFARADLQLAQREKLGIWLRPQNRARFNERDIREYFSILGKMKPRGLIFEGGSNEVLGFPDQLPATVAAMREHGMLFGNIEVAVADAAQKGSQSLGNGLSDRTARVMSFSPAFQAKLPPADVVDKFVLGVRERNIRVLYLRFFATPEAGKNLLQSNLDYVKNLAEALRKVGFQTGAAAAFPPLVPPLWTIVLMSLGVAAGGLLLLNALLPLGQRWQFAILGLAPLLGAVACVLGRQAAWSKMAALAAALVFGTLGIVTLLPRLIGVGLTTPSPARAMLRAAWLLIVVTAISVVGGVLVAGLLAATPFMLSIDQFRGIKLVMLLPPAVVALYFLTRAAPRPQPLRELMARGVAFWHLFALAALVAALGFYVLRTGNTTPAAASDLEISLRNFLENLLVARPRFKEFMLGHPAWIAAAVLLWERRWEAALWLFIAAAAIGQADIVDTFAHIHTPFLISLLRVFNGLWLGIFVGFVTGMAILWLLWRFPSKEKRLRPHEEDARPTPPTAARIEEYA